MAKSGGILSSDLIPIVLAGGAIYAVVKSDFFGKLGQGFENIGTGLGSGVSKIGDIGTGLGGGLYGIGTGLGGGLYQIGGGLGNFATGTSPASIITAAQGNYSNPYGTQGLTDILNFIKTQASNDNTQTQLKTDDTNLKASDSSGISNPYVLPNNPSFYNNLGTSSSSTKSNNLKSTSSTSAPSSSGNSAQSIVSTVTTLQSNVNKIISSSITSAFYTAPTPLSAIGKGLSSLYSSISNKIKW